MYKKSLVVGAVALVAVSFLVYGCKGKTQSNVEDVMTDISITSPAAPQIEELQITQPIQVQAPEPAQVLTTEAAPVTAAVPQPIMKPNVITSLAEKSGRNKEIQQALKNGGYYTGAVDGKIGPKTKKAIMDFQRAKGLKVDGKVGSRTWGELETLLAR